MVQVDESLFCHSPEVKQMQYNAVGMIKYLMAVYVFRAYSGYIRLGVFISLWEFMWGFNSMRYTLVHGFCFVYRFFMGPKELIKYL